MLLLLVVARWLTKFGPEARADYRGEGLRLNLKSNG